MNEEREIGYLYKDTLTSIANAIRNKLLSTVQMKPSEMSNFIGLIDTSGIHPTGTKTITANGITDVYNFQYANVQVPIPTGVININSNGVYDVTNYASANVQTPSVNDYFTATIPAGTSSIPSALSIIKTIPSDMRCDANMSNAFRECHNLVTFPLIDTSNVTNMNSMFYRCTSLQSVSEIDVSNVDNFNSMFYGCTNLTSSVKLTPHKTSIDCLYMFQNCTNLTSVDMSTSYNVSFYRLERMFQSCTNITSINLKGISLTSNISGQLLFGFCEHLTFLDIRNFDFSLFSSTFNMLSDVPTNCEIIVADNTQKTWMNTNFPAYTNVKTVAEYQAS